MWQAVTGQDGKVYYYNADTGQSTWERPQELFTDFERALAKTDWKEYVAEGGHKYWYNTVTQQSVWTIPNEVQELIDSLQQFHRQRTPPSGPRNGSNRPSSYISATNNVNNQTIEADRTPEEAAQLYREALEAVEIATSTTWEEALGKLVLESGYWAVTSPVDRKQYFEAYKREKESRILLEARKLQVNLHTEATEDFKKVKDIKYYTRWCTYLEHHRDIIRKYQSHELFTFLEKDPEDSNYVEKEIRYAFEQYTKSLRAQHEQSQELVRARDREELSKSLAGLNIQWDSKWSDIKSQLDAEGIISMLPRLHLVDFLAKFEVLVKDLEQAKSKEKQLERARKFRSERKVRQAFIQILRKLHSEGKIRADTKWPNIVGSFVDDEKFVAICQQRTGSTPLELFWDITEEESQKLKIQKEHALDVLASKNLDPARANITWEDFQSLFADRNSSIAENNLKPIYDQIVKNAEGQRRDLDREKDRDRYASERKLRRAQDEFWYALKYVEPLLRPTDKWEDVKPNLEKMVEYKDLPDEKARKEVFERFLLRQQDRERRKERDRERDRDRMDDRSRRSRSPSVKRDSRGTPQVPYRRGPVTRGNDYGPYLEY